MCYLCYVHRDIYETFVELFINAATYRHCLLLFRLSLQLSFDLLSFVSPFYTFFRPIMDNLHGIPKKCNQFRQSARRIMPERPPKCRTAKIACTISELHALPPKLDGKMCTNSIICYHYLFLFLTTCYRPPMSPLSARSKKVAPPDSEGVFMGPVNNRAQFEKVKRYLDLAREEGGTVQCGETADPPLTLPAANAKVSQWCHGVVVSWCQWYHWCQSRVRSVKCQWCHCGVGGVTDLVLRGGRGISIQYGGDYRPDPGPDLDLDVDLDPCISPPGVFSAAHGDH